MTTQRPTIRLDKWLWFARFFKSRGLGARMIASGHCRVNSVRVRKVSIAVGAGDVLTFPKETAVRVIEIVDIGTRRGPALEAQAMYVDLSPPEPGEKTIRLANPEAGRIGRPNRKQRAEMGKFEGRARLTE